MQRTEHQLSDGSKEIIEQVADIHSCQFSLTAKGDITFEVKAYAADPISAVQYAHAMALRAMEVKRQLEKREGGDFADGND